MENFIFLAPTPEEVAKASTLTSPYLRRALGLETAPEATKGAPRATPAAHEEVISIEHAREHNLKDVSVEIPKRRLTVFTGVSGSGKSSLAYHTIYQEGQRRFLESLSSYARQFLGRMEKPKVDLVEGLSPTVSIDQKSTGASLRSTVGTRTSRACRLRRRLPSVRPMPIVPHVVAAFSRRLSDP